MFKLTKRQQRTLLDALDKAIIYGCLFSILAMLKTLIIILTPIVETLRANGG